MRPRGQGGRVPPSPNPTGRMANRNPPPHGRLRPRPPSHALAPNLPRIPWAGAPVSFRVRLHPERDSVSGEEGGRVRKRDAVLAGAGWGSVGTRARGAAAVRLRVFGGTAERRGGGGGSKAGNESADAR